MDMIASLVGGVILIVLAGCLFISVFTTGDDIYENTSYNGPGFSGVGTGLASLLALFGIGAAWRGINIWQHIRHGPRSTDRASNQPVERMRHPPSSDDDTID